MKEDCSGTCIVFITCNIGHQNALKSRSKTSLRWLVSLQLSELVSSGSLRVSCIRCGVRFSLSVLISQRHLVHVHRANVGLGHRQQQHWHTDGATGWESVNTSHGHVSACSPFTISTHQLSPFFLLFTPSYPHFVFCSVFDCFFGPFFIQMFSSFLLNLNEKVYFSIFFLCDTFILLILFNFTLGVRTAGQMRSKLSLWILFNLIKYVWCTHPHGFSGYQESVGGLLFVLYACILIVLFF